MNGKFISFEGGEGSGKTTIIKSLVKELEKNGYSVLSTREPGGSDIAEQIRSLILNVDNTAMGKETETLLYAASRIQHLEEKILPALKEGKVVICDRYLDSSLAYQGHARGVGFSDVLTANTFALKHMPEMTFFIDVTPEVGMKRIIGRDKMDRLDLESYEFHNKVYEGYLRLCKMYPTRIIRIDGNRSCEEICEEINKYVMDFLNK